LDQLGKGFEIEPGSEVGRRPQNEIAQHAGREIEITVERSIALRVGGAELGNLPLGAAFADEEIAAIRRRKKILRAAFDDAQAMIMKAQIADDLRVQQAHRVRADRIAEAGIGLLRTRGARDDGSALALSELDPPQP